MIQYVIKIAEAVAVSAENGEIVDALELREAFAEELDRLDPRDFLPSAQFDFVAVRSRVRRWASQSGHSSGELPEVGEMARQVIDVLAQYGGLDSRAARRSFAFIEDVDLRRLVERDYGELVLRVFPSGSWKSTVVLAGSILEAILYDQMTSLSRKQSALASGKAPKDKSGSVLDLDKGEWKLFDLIEVAADISMLPKDRSKSIDQVLRDYRNFVHPKKEIRAKYPCTEAEAMMAIGALEAVCNVLTPSSDEAY